MRHNITMLTGLLAISLPAAAFAQDAKPTERPEAFRSLLACRSITDASQRLACFDTQVANLDEAERKSDVVIVDRQQVRTAKRKLFGLSLPSFGGLVGRGDDGEEDVSAIESTISSARQIQSGKWSFEITDGARWTQTDTRSISTPRKGQPIRIRKAAMGSFFANVNGQTAIRVKREN